MADEPRIVQATVGFKGQGGMGEERPVFQGHPTSPDEHIERALLVHPEHKRDDLRAFLKHEATLKYFDRCELEEAMKPKGLDPHNIEHRHRHHLDRNGMGESNGTDTGN